MKVDKLKFFPYYPRIVDIDDIIEKINAKAFLNNTVCYSNSSSIFFNFVIKQSINIWLLDWEFHCYKISMIFFYEYRLCKTYLMCLII